MQQLSASGQQKVNELAQKHGFSPAAVSSMLDAVMNGNGAMAQFNHPEFSGPGQWMKGGMTMVSDMFNNSLKDRVDRLCSDLSNLVANQSARSDLLSDSSTNHGEQRHARRQDWWPTDLSNPNSTGGQNDMRYAYFAQARRLAIDDNGRVTVYDTLDHQIGGVSQQQSSGTSLTFTSQHGVVDLSRLPIVSAGNEAR